ncbi:hypothetical protein RhiirB3_449336 [Rhizophagus irregularis]|nr:hypothetical protein RhiirB3_449336 [Rhizophagus irregularis]
MEANEISLPLQTDQQVKKKKPVEIYNYPKESIIQYSNNNYEIKVSLRKPKTRQSEKLSLNAAYLYAKNNRAKKIAKSISTIFDQVTAKDCHSDDNLNLKSIEFDIRNNFFYLGVNKENIEEIKYKAKAAVQACDKGQVSCEGYRILASISQDLNNINDAEIVYNIQQLIGKGGQQNVVDILKYLISGLIERKILDVMNPKIHLRISDDGRNVGQKVKQVMITCSIFDDINNLY